MDRSEAVNHVKRALSDPDPSVRAEAIGALARLTGSRVTPDLVEALGDPVRVVQNAAVRAISALVPVKRKWRVPILLGLLRTCEMESWIMRIDCIQDEFAGIRARRAGRETPISVISRICDDSLDPLYQALAQVKKESSPPYADTASMLKLNERILELAADGRGAFRDHDYSRAATIKIDRSGLLRRNQAFARMGVAYAACSLSSINGAAGITVELLHDHLEPVRIEALIALLTCVRQGDEARMVRSVMAAQSDRERAAALEILESRHSLPEFHMRETDRLPTREISNWKVLCALSPDAMELFQSAVELAAKHRHARAHIEHLLLALLLSESPVAKTLRGRSALSHKQLVEMVKESLQARNPVRGDQHPLLSGELMEAVRIAFRDAYQDCTWRITPAYLLQSIVRASDEPGAALARTIGVTDRVISECIAACRENAEKHRGVVEGLHLHEWREWHRHVVARVLRGDSPSLFGNPRLGFRIEARRLYSLLAIVRDCVSVIEHEEGAYAESE